MSKDKITSKILEMWKEKNPKAQFELSQVLQQKYNLSYHDAYLLLDDMVADDLIEEIHPATYVITRKGLDVLNNGGYLKYLKSSDLEGRKGKVLKYIKLGAAIATILGGIIALWEFVLKYCLS